MTKTLIVTTVFAIIVLAAVQKLYAGEVKQNISGSQNVGVVGNGNHVEIHQYFTDQAYDLGEIKHWLEGAIGKRNKFVTEANTTDGPRVPALETDTMTVTCPENKCNSVVVKQMIDTNSKYQMLSPELTFTTDPSNLEHIATAHTEMHEDYISFTIACAMGDDCVSCEPEPGICSVLKSQLSFNIAMSNANKVDEKEGTYNKVAELVSLWYKRVLSILFTADHSDEEVCEWVKRDFEAHKYLVDACRRKLEPLTVWLDHSGIKSDEYLTRMLNNRDEFRSAPN